MPDDDTYSMVSGRSRGSTVYKLRVGEGSQTTRERRDPLVYIDVNLGKEKGK